MCYTFCNMKPTIRIALQIERSRAHGRALLEGIADYALRRPEWRLDMLEPDLLRHPDTLSVYDGFIVRVMDEATAALLVPTGKPVIDTYGRLDATPFPTIRLDDAAIAEQAAATLGEHRFTRFAYCGFPGLRFSDARGAAFADAIAARGGVCSAYDGDVKTADTFFRNERTDRVPDAAALRHWVKSLPRATAVFCCNDIRAFQLLRVCESAGIDVPGDLAVLGVDNDTLLCTFANPSLSSIDTNPTELGRRAAEMLDRRLRDPEGPPETVLHPPHRVVERRSTEIYPFRTPWLSDALIYINRHLADGVSAADVIAYLGYSHTTVNKAFRAELGVSVQEEILRRRLALARRLLRTGNLTSVAVAAACGYPNAQYFSRAFAAATGLPPDTWRAAAR